jgi:hypothetical protein
MKSKSKLTQYQYRALGQTDPTPKYYVYLLIDPFTNEVFYVGKGTHDRMRVHERDVRKGKLPNESNSKLFNKINAIVNKEGHIIYEKAIEKVTEIEALALEAAYIDFYGKDQLCNIFVCGFGGNLTYEQKMNRSYVTYKHYNSDFNGTLNDYKQLIKTKLLKEDLKLLDEVINDIRKQRLLEWDQSFIPLYNLGAKIKREQMEKQIREEYLITVNDKEKQRFVRLCPVCCSEVCHKNYASLLYSAKSHRKCKACEIKNMTKRVTSTEHRSIVRRSSKARIGLKYNKQHIESLDNEKKYV